MRVQVGWEDSYIPDWLVPLHFLLSLSCLAQENLSTSCMTQMKIKHLKVIPPTYSSTLFVFNNLGDWVTGLVYLRVSHLPLVSKIRLLAFDSSITQIYSFVFGSVSKPNCFLMGSAQCITRIQIFVDWMNDGYHLYAAPSHTHFVF